MSSHTKDVAMTPTIKNKTPVLAEKQMSASLKARLKKCGRSYSSPNIPAAKRTCLSPVSSTESAKCRISSTNAFSSDSYKYGSQTDPQLVKSFIEYLPSADKFCDKDTTVNRCFKNVSDDTDIGQFGKECNVIETDSVEFRCDKNTRLKTCNVENMQSVSKCSGANDHHVEMTSHTDMPPEQKRHCNSSVEDKETLELVSKKLSGSDLLHYDNIAELKLEKSQLLLSIAQKEEKFRKLNMVKMYRSKNDLSQLQTLIDKWRSVTQTVIEELHTLTSDPKPSLTQLVDYLQLEHSFIGYSSESESFE